jgi:hypothetical protein
MPENLLSAIPLPAVCSLLTCSIVLFFSAWLTKKFFDFLLFSVNLHRKRLKAHTPFTHNTGFFKNSIQNKSIKKVTVVGFDQPF